MTTIIQLFAGPGTGKSTSAAYLYSKLKSKAKNVELVREYVKNWAYTGRKIDKYDQMYITAKQIHSESQLLDNVEYIITDSPVLLGVYYTNRYAPTSVQDGVRAMAKAYYEQTTADGHQHKYIYLHRSKPYLQAGRYENENQAKDIDVGVRNILRDWSLPVTEVSTDLVNLDKIADDILAPKFYFDGPCGNHYEGVDEFGGSDF